MGDPGVGSVAMSQGQIKGRERLNIEIKNGYFRFAGILFLPILIYPVDGVDCCGLLGLGARPSFAHSVQTGKRDLMRVGEYGAWWRN